MFVENSFLPFKDRIWLASPAMHGTEIEYVNEAYRSNWLSTVGKNIDAVESIVSDITEHRYSVALSSGTTALHLCMELAGVSQGDRVFCSDMTFVATANPITHCGGSPIFVDAERDTWNMDPDVLEKAFRIYPDVKVVVVAHIYGVPGKTDELCAVCDKYGAVLVEDAADTFGALYKGRKIGSFGKFSVFSFNGNKIITGSSGGMLLTDDLETAEHARKLSAQGREDAPWYQHKEIGYNYRMSNVIAGLVRGQLPYLNAHIERKKEIYMRYKEGFNGLPVSMNPYDGINSEPNFWLSCMLIEPEAMCKQVRDDLKAWYVPENGRSCPTEILETLAKYNAEGRPIWKPMHMQPVFTKYDFVSACNRTEDSVSEDIFNRGLCLPSNIGMTEEQQDIIIEIVKSCFN